MLHKLRQRRELARSLRYFAIAYTIFHRYAVDGFMRDLVEDLIGEDEDGLRLSKRQHLGDYDHMRFGKRTDDDDEYGRSRFSRNAK